MSIYEDLLPTVNELMAEFKQGRITVREELIPPRPSNLPTWEEWNPITTVNLYELDATARAVGLQGREGIALENGTAVQATDLIVTCSPRMWLVEVDGVAVTRTEAPLNVKLLQTLQVDGVAGTTLAITNSPAAGTKLVHKFVFRK